jgi:dolichyl-phosphate-mannose-protein mannosyltransferase
MLAVAAACHICDSLVSHCNRAIAGIFRRGCVLSICTLFDSIGSFVVHLTIAPFDGPGAGFLPDETRTVLLTCDHPIWAVRRVHLMRRIVGLVLEMHRSNMNISEFHECESRSMTWPLPTGPHVEFWMEEDLPERQVDCNGNVYVYVMALDGIVVVTCCALCNRNWADLIILFGYYVSSLPFFLTKRAMFLYHYHIPLLFAWMAFGACLDLVFDGKIAMVVAVAAALRGFCTWDPFVSGIITVAWRMSNFLAEATDQLRIID